jgi:ATP-dependent Clp protease protease subunit
MNSIIIEKTDAGEVSYDVFSKLIEGRILFLTDYIDDKIASEIVATLIYLDHLNENEPISIYINSEGGAIDAILMIYDAIMMITAPIQTFCVGWALNEVVLILAAGANGMRFATPSSTIGLNQLSNPEGIMSDMKSVEIRHKKFQKENESFIKLIANHIDKPFKELFIMTERPIYMNVNEAKKFRIIDHIIKNVK